MQINYFMKNKLSLFFSIAFCLFSLKSAACQFCEEEPIVHQGAALPPSCREPQAMPSFPQPAPANRFTYVKLGGGAPTFGRGNEVCPAIGIGRRYEFQASAVDISMNYTGDERLYSYSIPRIMYLRYMDPFQDDSLYLGGGLSWGGIHGFGTKFQGILGELSAGYEFQRRSPIRTFAELTLSQGVLNTYNKGRFPSPVLILSAGIGY